MTWHSEIRRWLKMPGKPTYLIGMRDVRWINSFREDLKRWGFPVRLIITNPVMVGRKVSVAMERWDDAFMESK